MVRAAMLWPIRLQSCTRRKQLVQQNALEDLYEILNYVISNEQTSYEEFVAEGGNPQDHIFMKADRVRNSIEAFIKGNTQ